MAAPVAAPVPGGGPADPADLAADLLRAAYAGRDVAGAALRLEVRCRCGARRDPAQDPAAGPTRDSAGDEHQGPERGVHRNGRIPRSVPHLDTVT